MSVLDLDAIEESVKGLRAVADAFERKGMLAGAKANRVLANQTQSLVAEVRRLRLALEEAQRR